MTNGRARGCERGRIARERSPDETEIDRYRSPSYDLVANPWTIGGRFRSIRVRDLAFFRSTRRIREDGAAGRKSEEDRSRIGLDLSTAHAACDLREDWPSAGWVTSGWQRWISINLIWRTGPASWWTVRYRLSVDARLPANVRFAIDYLPEYLSRFHPYGTNAREDLARGSELLVNICQDLPFFLPSLYIFSSQVWPRRDLLFLLLPGGVRAYRAKFSHRFYRGFRIPRSAKGLIKELIRISREAWLHRKKDVLLSKIYN